MLCTRCLPHAAATIVEARRNALSTRILLICVRAHDTAKVLAEVPEDSRLLRVRRLWFPTSNFLEPWLSPLERPGLDNIMSQPWFDATC